MPSDAFLFILLRLYIFVCHRLKKFVLEASVG